MLTRVVAMRHAKTINFGDYRTISDEGRTAQRKIAEKLKGFGIRPTQLLTSPLQRAVETAEILSEVFGVPYEMEPALGDEFNSDVLIQRIPMPQDNATVYMIGHAPTLTEFVNALVGYRAVPGILPNSAAALIDFRETPSYGKGLFAGLYTGST